MSRGGEKGERRERGGDLNEDEFPARERESESGWKRQGKKKGQASIIIIIIKNDKDHLPSQEHFFFHFFSLGPTRRHM